MYLKSVTGDKQAELRDQIIAGRSDDADLVLTQGHPSRRHAQITARDDGFWIEDLGSTNGTYVNDHKVEAPVRLLPGDRVRFDIEEFEVVGPAEAPDANATVLRGVPPHQQPTERADVPPPPPPVEQAAEPEPPPAAAPEPPPVAPQPPPARPEPREVEGGGAARRPGAWADPDQANQGQTVMLDKGQLEALLASNTPSPQPLADADAPTLVVTAGAQAGAAITLKAGQHTNVWEVGRDAGRDIRFDENGVSAFHAKIVNEGARWKVIDQMSANGTLVNEKRGTISFLSSGDRIRFGPVECVFQLPSGGKARAGAKAGGASGSKSGARTWIIAAVVVAALAAAAYFVLGA